MTDNVNDASPSSLKRRIDGTYECVGTDATLCQWCQWGYVKEVRHYDKMTNWWCSTESDVSSQYDTEKKYWLTRVSWCMDFSPKYESTYPKE